VVEVQVKDVRFSNKERELSSGIVNGLGIPAIRPLPLWEGSNVHPLEGLSNKREVRQKLTKERLVVHLQDSDQREIVEYFLRLSHCFAVFEA